ncbi:hypothetical protein N2152v2_009459 [Parachlorella kessleri]
MSPASSTAISQTSNFLSDVFAQRGASDSPYDAQFQSVIRQHLLDLVGDIPSLTVKQQLYTHYDGRSARLLVAEGTIPMYYQGVKYNIPVALWLPERYPLAAPLAYVVPTADMVIKPRHSYVDPSGLVGSPYLRNWAYPASNLREMAQDTSILFSGDPPLFSKPPGWAPPPVAPRPPSPGRPAYPGSSSMQQHGSGPYSPTAFHAENPIHGSGASFTSLPSGSSFVSGSGGSFTSHPSYPGGPLASGNPPYGASVSSWGAALGTAAAAAAAGGGGGGAGGPPPMYPGFGPPPGPGPSPPPLGSGPPAQQAQQQEAAACAAGATKPQRLQAQASSAAEDASRELRNAFRTAAVATLGRRLAASAAAAQSGSAAEVDRLAQAQAELARREAHLQQEVASLQAERIALDRAAQELGAAGSQLDHWLANNERALDVVRGKDGGGGGPPQLDPDAAIVAADALSQQALDVQAFDLALEDALYALDKALNAGLVQPDAYIKQVRAVCRQQFMARAVGNKIAAKQSEARRRQASPSRAAPAANHTPAAAGSSGGGYQQGAYHGQPGGPQLMGVQMPQGDSWFNSGILPNPLAAQQR